MSATIGDLVIRCFHARTAAHILHLTSTSYAKHVALNGFYDDIVDLVDRLAEAYMGEHGVISFAQQRYTPCDDPVKLVDELAGWIEDNRYDAIEAEDSYLHNVVDEILALCRSTKYKLARLK